MSADWTHGRVALAAFFAALLAYLSNGSLFPLNADTAPNVYLSASVLGDGDLAFSPFEAPFMFLWSAKGADGADVSINVQSWNQVAPGSAKSFAEHYAEGRLQFRGSKYYVVPTARERPQTGEPLFVGTFGAAAGLSALPFAALAQLAGARLWRDQAAAWGIAKLTAAVLTAASAAMIYLIAVGFVSRSRALLLCAAYALGTCVWSTSSHSLWQQTPEIFLLSLGVLCLLRVPAGWLRGAAAGCAFSAAAACRPTAALVAGVAVAWLLLSDRRAFAAFLVAAVPFAAATLAYNLHYFGSPLEFGQLAAGERVAQYKTGSTELWQTPLWLGAAGLLVSPSRGLLIYSPFLAAAFLGAVLAWKDPRYRALRFLTLAVPALWMPAFLWFDWWGGWTYGYRPIVDSVPLLAVLCLPALARILERPLWRTVFAVAIAWSIFVQALGVFVYSPRGWNTKALRADGPPADVDQAAYRGRLWSFRDWQIGYLIANFRQARAERELVIAY
ncbi:MAG TPA: hypothetical protein VGJ74_06505 [Burkholderiales bacterium]